MDYCMQHPDEISKMANLQRKVRLLQHWVVQLVHMATLLHALPLCLHLTTSLTHPINSLHPAAHYANFVFHPPSRPCRCHAPLPPLLQVDEVKGIMLQNVEQVLVRGERLDVLVDRADDLRDQVTLGVALQ
jgi:hypothetical protein